jgi:hypothetical protein
MAKRPPFSPSTMAPKIDALSNLGQQSQSRETSAAARQSPTAA